MSNANFMSKLSIEEILAAKPSFRYTGIESHEGLSHYGLYDTVVLKSKKADAGTR